MDGGANADEIRERKIDDHKRHGEIECRKGSFSQKTADESAVEKLIKRRSQHAHGAWYSGDGKQFQRRRL